MLGFLIRIETVVALLILIVIPHPFYRNDVISGEVNGVSDVNLSSGVEVGFLELSSEDSGSLDEILAIADDIPVPSELPKATPPKNVSVSNINSTGNDSGAIEEDIPSFSEWKQKVWDQEEKSGANSTATGPASVKILETKKNWQKNYASPDCGAKILDTNPEAAHSSAVLEPSRDKYLLNICTSKIWFVIELCEAIQAKKIEIANFELFSSSPKYFRVYISDRLPTRDWALLGEFIAADERTIQSFIFEQALFGKFVKVEILSHYGTEHYCPISLFRVYGNSEYEVLDIEESRTDEEFSTDEDALELKNNREEEGGNIISSVITIIKKTVDYGFGKGITETKDTNQTILIDRPFLCYSLVNQLDVPRTVNKSLSCQWNLLNYLTALPWLRSSVLEQCRKESNTSFYSPELGLATALWGIPTVQALCHWDHQPVMVDVELVVKNPPIQQEERTETIFGPVLKAELEQLEKLLTDTYAPVINADVEPTVIDNKLEDFVNSEASKAQPVPVPLVPTSPVLASVPNNVQHKESVFVRLTNRIKTLERNMSLSGQYLEELSRRYKRQVDDMQKTLNRTMQALNETLRRITTQEDHFQSALNFMNGEIEELKLSTQLLTEENLILRTQIVERHIFLMMMEVGVFLAVTYFLKRSGQPPTPPPSPTAPAPPTRQILPLEYHLEVGQRVENLTVLQVREMHKPSPAPSLADSTSSGCESAFSAPTSTYNASRDASLEKEQNRAKPIKGSKKKKKKGGSTSSSLTSSFHKKDPKSTPSSPKIRLKSDNWEWHSRAKILAAEFIKESYEINGLRSSM